MQRPVEIVRFERLYLGTLALGLIQSWLDWPELVQLANPNFVLTTQVFGIGIDAGLALLVSRRRSNIAKWISIVLFLFCLPSVAKDVMEGQLTGSASISVIQTLGLFVAYALLFAPASVRWLKQDQAPA